MYTTIFIVTYAWCDYSKFNFSTIIFSVFQCFLHKYVTL